MRFGLNGFTSDETPLSNSELRKKRSRGTRHVELTLGSRRRIQSCS
jgi:hypothetical protein